MRALLVLGLAVVVTSPVREVRLKADAASVHLKVDTASVHLKVDTTAASEPGVVRIDAVASDAGGRSVDNLNPGDFEVLEDGVPRTIDSVRFVNADGRVADGESAIPIQSQADERTEAAREGTRLFAIFLDEFHVSAGPGVARARAALTRFVQDDLGPRDLVVIVKPLDSLLTLRLTRDRDKLLQAISGFEGRKGDYAPRTTFEKNFMAGTSGRVDALRAQIATSALNAVALHLGSLGTGRKAILVVSEGFMRIDARRRGEQALPTLDSAIRAANRASVSLYAFDPGGTESTATPPERDTLRALADATEGQIIADDDPSAGLKRIVTDASAYYLIAFQSAHTDPDGRFHAVAVRARRPGVELRARNGYWNVSAEDLARARLLARAAGPKAAPEPPRRISPLIRPWFGMARGDGGRTEVTFVWEPVVRVPGDRVKPVTPARILFKASKPDGTTVFEGAVRSTGAGANEVVDVDPARLVFETTPGRLKLQMSIEDGAARVVDTDVRDVVVSPLTSPVAIGTAEVLRARNVRDFRAVESDPNAAPVAAREFSRTERLLIRLPAYAPDGAPNVSARLVSRLGSTMRELPVAAAPRPSTYQMDVPLAGLAAGDYAVQFVIDSPAGQAKDSLDFRVTP